MPVSFSAVNRAPLRRLAAFYFLFFAVAGAAMPYLPVLLDARGFDAAAIGTILSIGVATKIVAPNLWAWWADRSGARLLTIRLGVLGGACAFALLEGVPNTLVWVAGVLALYNVFWNSVLPQFEVVTLRHLAAQEGRYSELRLWGSVGFVLAVLVAGWLTQEFGISWLVPIVTTLLLLLGVASLAVYDADSGATPQDPQRVANNALWDAVRQPGVAAFLGAVVLMQASHGPYYAFFTLQMEGLGFERIQASMLWVLGVLAEVVLFAYAPRLFKRFTVRSLFIATASLTAARWLAMALAADVLGVLLAAQLLHAISFGLCHACAIQIVRKHFSGPVAGRGQALYGSIGYGVGSAIGTFSAGVLWATYGPYGAYLGASLAALGACVLLWRCMQ